MMGTGARSPGSTSPFSETIFRTIEELVRWLLRAEPTLFYRWRGAV